MTKQQILAYQAKYAKTLSYLQSKSKVLLLTTSNRWSGEHGGEQAKSTLLATKLAKQLGPHATLIEVPKLKIYPCEGNVSTLAGNSCGQSASNLNDKIKNPSNCHRCWASFNHTDDDLWQISRQLLQADCVLFFGSIRWGQMNSEYQKLLERLTWLENRHSTLGETNLLKNIDTGIIAVGHNWHGAEVIKTQRQVLKYFGFRVKSQLCWNWQYTKNISDESNDSYLQAAQTFTQTFLS